MTLTKALAAVAILSMTATPVYAAKSNNAAAKLSLEQPNVYPTGASAGQVPSRTKASKMTVPLIVAGVAVVVGAAVLLGQNGSTPASR